jgi:hypothetical protein
MAKQTAEEKQLGDIAIQQWNRYQQTFKPFEDQYIRDVRMTDSDYSHVRGEGNTAVQQSFSIAENNLKDNIFLNGVDPSSDAFVKAIDGLSVDRGISKGASANEAELAIDNAHIQGLQNVVSMGQGQAAESLGGLAGVAQDSTQAAIDRSRESFNERSAGLQLVGTVGGAAAAYSQKDKKEEE